MTPTQEHGKLLAAMHEVKLSGEPDMPTGINVAQVRVAPLALADPRSSR